MLGPRDIPNRPNDSEPNRDMDESHVQLSNNCQNAIVAVEQIVANRACPFGRWRRVPCCGSAEEDWVQHKYEECYEFQRRQAPLLIYGWGTLSCAICGLTSMARRCDNRSLQDSQAPLWLSPPPCRGEISKAASHRCRDRQNHE